MSHDKHRKSRGSCRRIRVLTSLSLVVASIARGQTNSWTDGNGKWENSNNWSQAVAPSLSDSADIITNAGNKTVTIDATTTNSPGTMIISNLYIAGTASSTNTLFLNTAGTNTPLQLLYGGLTLDTNGALVVNNSAVMVANGLFVGVNGGNASLIITNGGALYSLGADVGDQIPSSDNAVLVSGPGSVWSNGMGLVVGASGAGNSLVISNGGAVYASDGALGYYNSNNTAVVTGPGSIWNNTGSLTVGFTGSGNALTITSSGTVYNTFGYIGYAAGVSNTVLVTGPGSVWNVQSNITVADSGGSSLLTITNGGFVQADKVLIAHQPGSSGALIIAGGTNEIFSDLNVGVPGSTGTVTVASGALFVTNTLGTASTTVNGTNNTLILGAGTYKTDNLIVTNGGVVEYVQAYQVDNAWVTVAGGTVQADSSYVVAPSAGSTGTVVVTAGELVATNGVIGVGNDGTLTNGYGVGTVTVSNGTVLGSSILLGSTVGGKGQLTVQTNGLVSLVGTNAVLVANDLTVDGGDVEIVNGIIYCGESHPGAMTMNTGTANCQITYVGYDSQGTLTMVAGQMTVSSLLEIGFTSGSTGSVWMSGGQLTATALPTTIGNSGVGQMSISNGIVMMADVFVANSSNPGTLTLAGGTLTVNSLVLPNPNSQFNFTGGWLNALGITNSNGQILTLGNGVTATTLSLLGGISFLGNGLMISANATLTGCGTINGNVVVNPGGTVLANCGNLNFSGIVTNSGTMRAINGSVLEASGLVVNNGTIDIINGGTNFHGGFINNHGTVLTASSVQISQASRSGQDSLILIPSVTGHTYQLQYTTSLTPANWTPTGSSQSGTGGVLTFTDPGGATNLPSRFYRMEVTAP